jgi:hypothetical protein
MWLKSVSARIEASWAFFKWRIADSCSISCHHLVKKLCTVEKSSNEGGGHDFRIVHLALAVFLMMHGFQQIVTQAERRDNFVVHGLAPPE